MVLHKRKIVAVTLAVSVSLFDSTWFVRQTRADKQNNPVTPTTDKARHPSKLDLTPETLTYFRDLVRPADNEWRHLKVHWLTDIVAARKKAAQEDKPILIFRTGGAGYNDPLGVC